MLDESKKKERRDRTIKLTARTLERLKPEPDKQVDYFDEDLRSFCIRVSPSGHKSFCVFYRRGRQLRRFTIGAHPPLSLADARAKAKAALNNVADGRDPGEEKIQLREAGTFGELATLYMDKHGKVKKGEKSQAEDQRQLNTYLLPQWKHVPACSISIDDVEPLLDNLAERAPVQANRTRALLRHMFRWALSKRAYRRQFALTMNPVADVPRPAVEKARDRVYSDAELKAIWQACDEIGAVGNLFKLQLLTAARPGEVSSIKWSEVDFKEAVWTQPARKTKNGKEHIVPLATAAVRILEHMKQEQAEFKNDRKRESPFVFQNPRNPSESITWLQKAAERVRDNAKVTDFRPHDLRRTVATRLAKMGVADSVLKMILNHSLGNDITGGVYNQYKYFEERKQALESWARRLTVIVSGLQEVKTAD